jgi:hypothetical protein
MLIAIPNEDNMRNVKSKSTKLHLPIKNFYMMEALLLNLSYNYQKQAQFNTVVVQQIKVDRVGFEPTTSVAQ